MQEVGHNTTWIYRLPPYVLQGDVVSATLLFDYFQQFYKASRLIANITKNSIYFRGVLDHVQHEIVQQLGFSIGTLPFKYLGVPLSSKRLATQCQPLIDRMLRRITN